MKQQAKAETAPTRKSKSSLNAEHTTRAPDKSALVLFMVKSQKILIKMAVESLGKDIERIFTV